MRRHDLAALRALYDEVDALLEGWSCEGSTECCRFALTGREPYLWPNEWALLERALAGRGGRPDRPRRALAVLGDCPLLDGNGRCVAYRDRPFGCRTYFCERARGPERRPPRAAIAAIGRRVAALAETVAPGVGPRRVTALLSARR